MGIGIYAYLLTYLLLPSFLDMLQQGGLTARNYQGRLLPRGAGLVILISTFLSLTTTLPFYGQQWVREGLVFLFLVAVIGFLGFLDDAIPCGGVRGIAGHLYYFSMQGHLDTGLIKAAGGITSAFFVSWLLSDDIYLFFLNGILLCLSINAVNLFDLRPGRAGKIFLFFMFPAFCYNKGGAPLFLCAAVVGAVLAYLPFDLQGQAMLGDTGSNVLGAVVGVALIWSFPPGIKEVVVLLFSLLHVFCEGYSLTKLISRVPILDFLDRLGRPEI